jgi:hypothetical protein
MAFAQLTYRESLRNIEACLGAMRGKLYHMGFRGRVTRSTLADANETHDWRIFAGFALVPIAIARHIRSYERETAIFDPLHYLALLEQKTRALDRAAPLVGWPPADCFIALRRLLEARLLKHGSREYIQVLRSLETFPIEAVTAAVEDALRLGTISFDAVRHLLLCRIECQPAAAGPGELTVPAARASAHHAGRRLHGIAAVPAGSYVAPGCGGGAMNNQNNHPEMPTPDTPQLLLEHRLKALRLPTILREYDEYDKVARQCAAEQVDFPRCLALFTTASTLVGEPIEARDKKHLPRFQKLSAGYELPIIDERGFVPLSKTGTELLFETFSQRYERASAPIAGNLPFEEWTEVFGSQRLTGALLDRIAHHVHILEMNGDSYRL